MAQYVYSMNRVGKIVPPKRVILKDISLSFFPGAKIGVLGVNGSGKSSLLRIMAGEDKEFEGEAVPMPNMRIGYLPQEPQLAPDKTVRETIEEGLGEIFDAKQKLEDIYAAYAEPDADFDKLAAEQARYEAIVASSGADTDVQMEIAADALRLAPWEATIGKLSGGEKRRVALCRLLLSKPDMLLLDEPTNHLDAESVEWLEQFLAKFPGTVVAVTHDRYFLDNAAEWILELDRGYGIPWKGNYSSWLEQKQQRLAREARAESARQKTLQRELEWLHMSPRARQAKAKARINQYYNLVGQAKERANEECEITIPPGPRLGDVVIRAEGIAKSYGDTVLYDNLMFDIPAGAIVGIIGPNGAGKTTLLRMIVGQEKPDTGTLTVGTTVKLAYVDQSRADLDPTKSVWEEISGGQEQIPLGERLVNSRAYVARFNLAGPDQQKKVGTLSGGERNRVHLAKMLKSGANVLLLDEPSNDLDVNTLRALEDALEGFAGSALIISHDRWFLDRVATHILAFEGDSEVYWFPGNYREYEEDRRRRLGAAADRPHRITYRKLRRA